MIDSTTLRIILVSGGSGGHVLPFQVMATYLKAQGVQVGGIIDPRGAKFLTHPQDFSDIVITQSLGNLNQPLSTIKHLVQTLRHCCTLFRKVKPHLVWGFGARATLIPLGVAKIMGIPYGLYNADTQLGRANKALSQWATAIAMGLPVSPLPHIKAHITGCPMRISFSPSPYPPPNPFHISVWGGSQGARFWHLVLPQALNLLTHTQKTALRITHQCSAHFLEEALAAYDASTQVILTPFIDDVAEILRQSHIVLTRSGAGIISELITVGRPAFFVPYPHSAQDHQLHNARFIQNRQGGWCYQQHEVTPQMLAERICSWINTPELLAIRAEAMAKIHPHECAAASLWRLMQKIIASHNIDMKSQNR